MILILSGVVAVLQETVCLRLMEVRLVSCSVMAKLRSCLLEVYMMEGSFFGAWIVSMTIEKGDRRNGIGVI